MRTVRETREALGLTQAELASLTRVSLSTEKRWEQLTVTQLGDTAAALLLRALDGLVEQGKTELRVSGRYLSPRRWARRAVHEPMLVWGLVMSRACAVENSNLEVTKVVHARGDSDK